MFKFALAIVAVLLIASCTTSGDINFERMSPEELAAYNTGKPLSQMIVCARDERNFSRVRRIRCATVEAMYGSVEQAGQLGVLNSVQGFVGDGI